MSKLKKVLLMCTAYALVAAIAVGGTIAYLQDTDSDVNVMTLGNVSIEQIEQQRKNDSDKQHELEEFVQNKPAYPAVYEGSSIPWAPADEWVVQNDPAWKVVADNDNVIDKFVSVKNNGSTDAYVRTIVAFEVGKDAVNDPYMHLVCNGDPWTLEWVAEAIEIDGSYYTIGVFTYTEILAAGETTIPNVKQVYLDKTATNEVCEAYGDTFDIIVISQAVQAAGFADATAALNGGFGDLTTPSGIALAAEWFEGALVPAVDTWDGTIDTSWYNDTDTEFVLTTAEQLAGLAKLVDEGNTFAGKTITLAKSVDLYALDENENRILFEPIGDASNADFSGVFDGNNKTIFNLRQDCNSTHVALFGAVYEGTVKNLVLDGAIIENDGSGYAGGIAAYTGASNFENITLRNTTVVNYNHNTAGIAAWCSNNGTTTTFDGINIEDTTTIGSWWGSYDTRVGGVVGAMNTGNYVVIKNSKIACKLDVYNDVTSNYQWYNYRMAGMVVADVRDNHTANGRTEANPARVTCENVEVIFGDWANYHYCEDASYGAGSYNGPGEYKFRRVEAGLGYGGIDLSSCDHAADETHNELIAFDCLFGARDGKGIYSINSFDGVTVTKN